MPDYFAQLLQFQSRQFCLTLICTLHLRRCKSWLGGDAKLSHTHLIFQTCHRKITSYSDTWTKQFKNQDVLKSIFKQVIEIKYAHFLTKKYAISYLVGKYVLTLMELTLISYGWIK